MAKQDFAQWLREARKQRGWSQAQLAEKIEVQSREISRWENGGSIPNPHSRQQLQAALGVDVGEELGQKALISSSHLPPRNPFFTGRAALLREMHTTLEQGQTTVVLCGLGGVGKTHIAVKYAYRYQKEYHYILWAVADSRTTLDAELARIASTLQLPEAHETNLHLVVDAVKRWLHTHKYWLLILDNVDDPDLVDDLSPRAQQGHLLITTQDARTFPSALEVQGMRAKEGAALLLRRAGLLRQGEFDAIADDQREAAMTLAREMEGLPLALDQAGAYISETGCSVSDYRDFFREQKGKLLAERGRRSFNHPASLTATIALALEKIKDIEGTHDLLRFCAFFHSQEIPEELFWREGADAPVLFQPTPAGKFRLAEAIRGLLRYSLIHQQPLAKTISLHRMVQEVLIAQMSQTLQEHWLQQAIGVISAVFADMELKDWPSYERYIAHAQACARGRERLGIETVEAARLLTRMGTYMGDRTRYAEVAPLFEQALAIQTHLLPADHPERAESIYNLGLLSLNLGQYANAETSITQALALLKQSYYPWHPIILTARNTLAEVYCAQGKYQQAENILREILPVRILIEREHQEFVAPTLQDLAVISLAQGKAEEAREAYEQALQIVERTLGQKHLTVAEIQNRLAIVALQEGDYEEAARLADESFSRREQALGSNHVLTAESLRTQALLHLVQEQFEEAEPLLQQVLEIRLQQLGPEHPDCAESWHELGCLYLKQKRLEKAEVPLQKAATLREKTLGPFHQLVAQSYIVLGVLYEGRQRHIEADWYFQLALEILEDLVERGDFPFEMRDAHSFLLQKLGLGESEL